MNTTLGKTMGARALKASDKVDYKFTWEVNYFPNRAWWKPKYNATVIRWRYVNDGAPTRHPTFSKWYYSSTPAIEAAKRKAAEAYRDFEEYPESKLIQKGTVPL